MKSRDKKPSICLLFQILINKESEEKKDHENISKLGEVKAGEYTAHSKLPTIHTQVECLIHCKAKSEHLVSYIVQKFNNF